MQRCMLPTGCSQPLPCRPLVVQGLPRARRPIPSSWTCTLSACPHPCSMNPHTRCRGALQRAHAGPVARLATLGSLAQRSAKTVSILSNARKESCRSSDGKTPARARTASEMMPACSGRMMERRTPRPARSQITSVKVSKKDSVSSTLLSQGQPSPCSVMNKLRGGSRCIFLFDCKLRGGSHTVITKLRGGSRRIFVICERAVYLCVS